jgi:hypothetical protein
VDPGVEDGPTAPGRVDPRPLGRLEALAEREHPHGTDAGGFVLERGHERIEPEGVSDEDRRPRSLGGQDDAIGRRAVRCQRLLDEDGPSRFEARGRDRGVKIRGKADGDRIEPGHGRELVRVVRIGDGVLEGEERALTAVRAGDRAENGARHVTPQEVIRVAAAVDAEAREADAEWGQG